MQRLEGKSIVITGGTKGVGRRVALAAVSAGACVTFAGRDEQAAAEIIKECGPEKRTRIQFAAGDLRKPADCEKLMQTAAQAYGGIDGLFNYAGILPAATLMETTAELFDDVFAIDVKGPFFCCKYVLPYLLDRQGGSIVNTGSVHAYAGEIDRAAYACAKGALLTLTKHLSMNYARDKIRCNWLTMGWVPTPGELALRQAEGREAGWLDKIGREVMPMGRLQTVEDHVEAILYLLSDASSQVTGSELQMTGGFWPAAPTYQHR